MAELETLGKYEIRRELGRGAMGVVYEGFDPMIKRVVALKTIRADQLGGENAETTEQLANGYTEEKMEIGAKSSGALGVSSSQQGGVGLDTMVQRLVQKSVWDIDNKYK